MPLKVGSDLFQPGPSRAILTVVLAGALVTYGGVSLFVAVFVLAPMAQRLFRTAQIPNRLIPATVFLGTSTFYDVGAAWNAGYPKCDPDPILRHDTARGAGSGDSRLGHHGRFWNV